MTRFPDLAVRTLRAPHCRHPVVVVVRRRRGGPVSKPVGHVIDLVDGRPVRSTPVEPNDRNHTLALQNRQDDCSMPVRRALEALAGRATLRRDGFAELDGRMAPLAAVVAEANRCRRADGRMPIAYPGVSSR
ncbi:MAG: hypothetical protein HQ481_00215 [Alphaproteobacteria bacterium]|nr:hypothetical protein [Alphaproteobacteria bacterium]